MGSSRLTKASGLSRANEVCSQVSCARSQVNSFLEISTAVRQTPLTEMLSPCFNSRTSFEERIVKRRCWPVISIEATRPTSSMIPVKINSGHGFSRTKDRLTSLLKSIQVIRSKSSIQIWISQISFYGEVLTQSMQPERLQVRGLTHLPKTRSNSKWH